MRNVRITKVTIDERASFIFSIRKWSFSIILPFKCLSFDKGIRHSILMKKFFPPVFLFESKFFHKEESYESISDTHECSDEDITQVMHAIVYARKSHNEYKKYPKREKFFLKIGDNHHE